MKLFPFISKSLLAFLGVFVGVLLIRLVFFRVDVQGGLVFLVKEFSAESVAEESTDVSLVHTLKTHVYVAFTFTVFSALTSPLTPKCSEHMEALFLVVSELKMLGPIHALNEVDKVIEGEDKLLHIIDHLLLVLFFILSCIFVFGVVISHEREIPVSPYEGFIKS